MTIYEKMARISADAQKKLVPDLLKIGNNFRAVSEAQIYDVLNPLMQEQGITYEIEVKDFSIKEFDVNDGPNMIHRFYATIVVKLVFRTDELFEDSFVVDSVGMGIDDGDKCAGKAYTYAVKYGLLKAFRLKFSDDSDARASETYVKVEKKKDQEQKKKSEHKPLPAPANPSRAMITEKQSEYLMDLCKKKGLTDEAFFAKWTCYPADKNIPMDIARNIIEELTKMEDDLPF